MGIHNDVAQRPGAPAPAQAYGPSSPDCLPGQPAQAVSVRINQDLCTGDGLCVEYSPTVFEFDIDGLAYVKDGLGDLQTAPGAAVEVPTRCVRDVLDAADGCPGNCIHVVAADGTPVAGPDA